MGPTIVEARTPELIGHARSLFREYAASLPFSLEYQGFTHELATLPGRYGPPLGSLLVALRDGEPAGVVALREIDPAPAGRTCEMKRLYVCPPYRGLRLGRLLAERILARGKELGYRVMRLDTSADMLAARRVYEALGFRPVARYNGDMDPATRFYERML